ncbi:MAG: ATP-binding protein [Chloroflexi bacterium]|nr:ATP-binding protein [Chloroflexota bacterium]
MEPLTVRNDLKSIDRLTEYVVTAASRAGLDEKATYSLRLAVDEIATNIITYGYQEADMTGDLTVTAVFQSDRLIIQLEDTGAAFDPRQAPPPDDLNQPPHKRKTGHLGIYLALWSVDGFRYESSHGCNRSAFIMQRPKRKVST